MLMGSLDTLCGICGDERTRILFVDSHSPFDTAADFIEQLQEFLYVVMAETETKNTGKPYTSETIRAIRDELVLSFFPIVPD